jgi:hypothetical protein
VNVSERQLLRLGFSCANDCGCVEQAVLWQLMLSTSPGESQSRGCYKELIKENTDESTNQSHAHQFEDSSSIAVLCTIVLPIEDSGNLDQ